MEKIVDKMLYSFNRKCNVIDMMYLQKYLSKFSKEEAFELIYDIDNINVIKYTSLEPVEKIKCYINVCRKQGLIYDKYINQVLKPLCKKDPNTVIECLKYYSSDYNRTEMILNISNEYLRLLGTSSILAKSYFDYQLKIIKSIKNKQILLKGYDEGNLNEQTKYAILTVMDDKFKIKHLHEYSIDKQVLLILGLKDEKLKKTYVTKEVYREYRAKLISAIKDEEFIISYFKTNPLIKFRLELISMIKNHELKNKLVSFMDPSVYKDAINSNNLTETDLFGLGNLAVLDELCDPKITFGVELECCGEECRDFLIIGTLLKNWAITEDGSVNNGIEVISPILTFDNQSFQQLEYICQLLKKGCFFTDSSCGGHIHFGFNYFKTSQEFKIFLKLYCAVEDILFLICNKKGTVLREGVTNYANKFSPLYNAKKDILVYADNIKRLGKYVKLVKEIPSSRYYALNIRNIGLYGKNTIEFRMPNGEITFSELVLNIQLFAKLMEKAKYLSHLLSEKSHNSTDLQILKRYKLILDDTIDNDEKVSLLLELLFVNETTRNKYLERYYDNMEKVKKRTLELRTFILNDAL